MARAMLVCARMKTNVDLVSVHAVVVSCLLAIVPACGKSTSKSDKEAPAAKPEATVPKPAEPEPAPKLPALSPMTFDAWGIKLDAPAGTRVINVSPGDAELKMPDNAKLSTESSCGWDIGIDRHWKADLASFYDSAKKDSLKDLTFLTDEKTDDGFVVYYTGKAPIGPMWGVNTGRVVGDRLILCSAGMNRLEKAEAACVLAVCRSIAAK